MCTVFDHKVDKPCIFELVEKFDLVFAGVLEDFVFGGDHGE